MLLGRGKLDWHGEPDGTLSVSVVRRETYSVLIGRGQLETLPSLVDQVSQSDSVVVVTDDNVAALLLRRVSDLLADCGVRAYPIVIPPGETSKSWSAAQQVIGALSAHGARRRTTLLALGGGVILDMAGFVAAVYMRGIPYIGIPTSLVGQLDAAIGGKTGIDHEGSKNLLGAFAHPAAVLIDPDLLQTLPDRDIRSGLAEAVKVGMLHPPLFRSLEELQPDSAGDIDRLTAIIRDAVRHKLRLLSDDPFEESLIRLLNLGHSFGHALEAATEFEVYRHGEAVAVGIALATMVSWHRGLCTAETKHRILACLGTCGLGIALPLPLTGPTWEALGVVRRIRNGSLNEVLPIRIGRCAVVEEITRDEFESAAASLAELTAALPVLSGEGST